MEIGSLRHRVTLSRVVQTQTSSGSVVRSLSALATVWASVEPLTGEELLRAQAVNAEITHRIRLRYHSSLASLKPADRAIFGSRQFDLQSVKNIEEKNRTFELLAVERIDQP